MDLVSNSRAVPISKHSPVLIALGLVDGCIDIDIDIGTAEIHHIVSKGLTRMEDSDGK